MSGIIQYVIIIYVDRVAKKLVHPNIYFYLTCNILDNP